MRNKKLLLGLLLLLGIGFATVSTTLLMTGNVNISTNNDDFDVIFTKAILDNNNISSTAIVDGGKKITFETKNLSKVGDISVLDFVVTNNSAMYDADVSIDCTASGSKNSYYEITKEVETPIGGKITGVGKVKVKLLKASVDDITETFTCTLNATAKERISRPVTYYAFGDPLTAIDRTTDYTLLKYPGKDIQAKVFVKLDADGVQKSLCIIKNESVECFKNFRDNFEEEGKHLNEFIGKENCSSYYTNVTCNSIDLYCNMTRTNINCTDKATNFSCYLSIEGEAHCY